MTTSHDERQTHWDHRLNRGRGGWLSHQGEVAHAYRYREARQLHRPDGEVIHLGADFEMVCSPGLCLSALAEGLEPYPPEAPTCPECAEMSGLTAKLAP